MGGLDLAKSFAKISSLRCAARSFDSNREVASELLTEVLKVTQEAPSAFNLQPYKIIVVQSREGKDALCQAMLGGNVKKLQTHL